MSVPETDYFGYHRRPGPDVAKGSILDDSFVDTEDLPQHNKQSPARRKRWGRIVLFGATAVAGAASVVASFLGVKSVSSPGEIPEKKPGISTSDMGTAVQPQGTPEKPSPKTHPTRKPTEKPSPIVSPTPTPSPDTIKTTPAPPVPSETP